jgi:replication factor C subunit 1
MPNLASMGVIAPATFASGNLAYPRFPEWLGKNSTTKRIERMIRDVREMCAHHLYTDKKAILFESIPLIFHLIFNLLKIGSQEAIGEAVSILEDFSLTMEAFKEHIIAL